MEKDTFYNSLTLTENNKFKNNNRLLSFGLDEVQLIHENIEEPIKNLIELTGLSDATIRRIIQAITKGNFDEYIQKKKEEDVNVQTPANINIHDINITIYNNKAKESVEKQKKTSNLRLKEWSKKIRNRGQHICAKCGKTDKTHNQAHHIFPKGKYPQLACDEGNGIVLCQKCHSEYHKTYEGRENAYNFIGWLNE